MLEFQTGFFCAFAASCFLNVTALISLLAEFLLNCQCTRQVITTV